MLTVRGLVLGIIFLGVVRADAGAQSSTTAPETCGSSIPKLHATLNTQLGFYGDLSLETLTFRLMNDSNETLDSGPDTWILFIDGKEIDDSSNLFLNGGAPTGGYKKVQSGFTYEFGKALPLSRYFPENREYKVYWKASGFQSNIAIVRGVSTKR
jgi:hypothetical protein